MQQTCWISSMGSFTKIYSRAFHPEDELTLTWDIGYKNVTLLDGKREVKHWELSKQFIEGVTINDERLGKVKLKFSDTKPIQLELKVNGKRYKPTKDGKQVFDLTGQGAVYWAMFIFTLIATTFSIIQHWDFLFNNESLTINGLLLGISFLYFLSAFLMSKKHYGAFFIGYSYMALHLLSMTYLVVVMFGFSFWIFLFLFFLIRLGIFIYLTLSIRKVIFAIRTANTNASHNLIDGKMD